MNVLDLAMKRVQLHKASNTHGGEWQGPCPACGGEDRFHVWPDQNDGRGGYWCRSCGKVGDNIQFLRDFDGLSFREACIQLNVDIPDQPECNATFRKPKHPPERPPFHPNSYAAPPDLWREKAEKFVVWAQEALAKNNEALSWLADRGISDAMAKCFRLGWNAGESGKDIYRARKGWGLDEVLKEDGRPKVLWIPKGLVIPCIIDGAVYRIRIRRQEGEPPYYVIPGSSMATMVIAPERRAFVIVESELDAIAVAAVQDKAGAIALGSVSAKPDAAALAVLSGSIQILNALDYDEAGARAMTWWVEQFSQCDRWPVPKGKDPGDAFRLGIDLDKWIRAGLPPALTISTPEPIRNRGPEVKDRESEIRRGGIVTSLDYPPEIIELLSLLRKNPGVRIINTPMRFTVLRNGKYVGGRINELVFRTPEVLDYITNHPAAEIDGGNLIIGGDAPCQH